MSPNAPKLHRAEVSSDKSQVKFILYGTWTVFHANWLCHYCPCGQCKQTSSGQRLDRSLPSSYAKIDAAQLLDDFLEVSFSPTHVARFPLTWLHTNRYDEQSLLQLRHPYASFSSSFFSRVNWNAGALHALEWLTHGVNGVCLVENTPRTEFFLLNEFIPPSKCETSHTLYGPSFLVEVMEDCINVAYSSERLSFHQDLAYYESPPGLQLLHCLEFDDSIQGGESTFVDGLAAANQLRSLDPVAFQTLCRIPCTFQKDHTHRADPAKMFFQRPHIQVNHLNQVIAVFWAPPFEGPLMVSNPLDVKLYFEAYAKFQSILDDEKFLREFGIKFRLKPGDLVVFNNRRYLHGREAFSVRSGANNRRRLHGCYLEMDRVLNRIRVLNWEKDGKEGEMHLEKRPGIGSFL